MTRPRFRDLKIRSQFRREMKPFYHSDLIGYDTETFDGKAVLFCDSKDNFIHPESLIDCLCFLTRKKYRGVLGWFKNINYDVEAILKWCDEKTIREFAVNCELYVPYKKGMFYLKYIPGKMVKISYEKQVFLFFDIGNFLAGTLDDLGKTYLAEPKGTPPITDWKSVTMADFYDPAMIDYCKRDAWLTEKLAQVFLDTCNRFGIFSKNYCSPASLATHYFLSKIDVPTLADFDGGKKNRLKLAYAAYKGGFITTFKRGYFENIKMYDINSAYPDAMTRLPDLTKGRFVWQLKGEPPPDAFMGWMDVCIETPQDQFKPFNPCYFSPVPIYVRKFNKNFYFVGKIFTTITALEYYALKNDFNITPLQGAYWIPENDPVFIYSETINHLYNLKSQYKTGDQNIYKLIKIILNGYYGKTIQKIKDDENKIFNTGQLFNPYHASYITADCRIKVYNLIKKHGALNCVAVMTDGVAFDTKRPLDEPTSKDLGAWGDDMTGRGVFLGSGLYTVKNDKKIKTALRGFKTTTRLDFFELLRDNRDNDKIIFDQNLRLSFKEALRIKKFDKWNIIEKGVKTININSDNKRNWARDFSNCWEVLTNSMESMPYFVTMQGKTRG